MYRKDEAVRQQIDECDPPDSIRISRSLTQGFSTRALYDCVTGFSEDQALVKGMRARRTPPRAWRRGILQPHGLAPSVAYGCVWESGPWRSSATRLTVFHCVVLLVKIRIRRSRLRLANRLSHFHASGDPSCKSFVQQVQSNISLLTCSSYI